MHMHMIHLSHKIGAKIVAVVVASLHTHSIYKTNGRGNFTFSASSAFHLVFSKLHSLLGWVAAAAKCDATSEFNNIIVCFPSAHKTYAQCELRQVWSVCDFCSFHLGNLLPISHTSVFYFVISSFWVLIVLWNTKRKGFFTLFHFTRIPFEIIVEFNSTKICVWQREKIRPLFVVIFCFYSCCLCLYVCIVLLKV